MFGEPVTTSFQALTIDRKKDFGLLRRRAEIERSGREVVELTGRKVPVQGYLLTWNSEKLQLWLDDHGFPVLLEQKDGFRAIESQYIRYGEDYGI
jgi:hypothetical protein